MIWLVEKIRDHFFKAKSIKPPPKIISVNKVITVMSKKKEKENLPSQSFESAKEGAFNR